QHLDALQELYWRHAVFANRLVELDDVVRRVCRHRDAELAGRTRGPLQQLHGAIVQLARHEDWRDQLAALFQRVLRELDRLVECAPTFDLVDRVFKAPAFAAEPTAAVVAGAEVTAHAEPLTLAPQGL